MKYVHCKRDHGSYVSRHWKYDVGESLQKIGRTNMENKNKFRADSPFRTPRTSRTNYETVRLRIYYFVSLVRQRKKAPGCFWSTQVFQRRCPSSITLFEKEKKNTFPVVSALIIAISFNLFSLALTSSRKKTCSLDEKSKKKSPFRGEAKIELALQLSHPVVPNIGEKKICFSSRHIA